MAKPGAAFTVQMPRQLDVTYAKGHWWTEVAGRELRLSNLDKVFWPEEGYTKGDLLNYYFNVAPLILPYLRGRPLTMKRMPDGVTGPHFYEKNAPKHTPDWMPRCRVESTEAVGGSNDFLMADDEAGLLFVINLGNIQFDPLHSRCATIEAPDYAFFDLDPFEPATFDDVRAVAMHVKAAMDALGLPVYPKTSGATGMQIYVPLEPGHTYEMARDFIETVGRHILRADPDRVTMEWQISNRTGKVFIDHNMNRRGANISAVYSARPEPGATVSTPVTWEEVEAGIHPSDFTIVNAHERFAREGDVFRGVLDEPVDLRPAMRGLGVAFSEPAGAPDPPRLQPMLATSWDMPFDDEAWRFEAKLDGVRTLVYVTSSGVRLVSRSGKDQTGQYPELQAVRGSVRAGAAVLDGEIIASTPEGRPSFQLLQSRVNVSSPNEALREQTPVSLVAFDLLWVDGREVWRESLEDRRRALESVVAPSDAVSLSFYRDAEGCAMFEASKQLGLEGVVAKKLGCPYQPGKRSSDWRKVKATTTLDCLIVGWTPGAGSRSSSFGALLVAARRGDGELVWCGQVGTGFDTRLRAHILDVLAPLVTVEPAVAGLPKEATYVLPEVVCEVEYLEFTRDGKLRAPSFKGLRPDLDPSAAVLPAG